MMTSAFTRHQCQEFFRIQPHLISVILMKLSDIYFMLVLSYFSNGRIHLMTLFYQNKVVMLEFVNRLCLSVLLQDHVSDL